MILATPTGSGKSLVATAAHAAALARGERSVYTAPIKALVSEKFFALARDFGPDNVGMVTGDASINPDAPIIACTAEILARNGIAVEVVNKYSATQASGETNVVDLINEGRIDIVVNNAAFQAPVDDFTEISDEQWRHTFAVNIDSFFHVTKAALKHLPDGSAIINTGSINGLRGNKTLMDYSATKGAVTALTYSLAQSLAPRNIRVNCVAPGPVWTPLIPATMDAERTSSFGEHVPMGRPAQPDEIAPSYVFFAAGRLSSYYSGEVLAPLGGETLPG